MKIGSKNRVVTLIEEANGTNETEPRRREIKKIVCVKNKFVKTRTIFFAYWLLQIWINHDLTTTQLFTKPTVRNRLTPDKVDNKKNLKAVFDPKVVLFCFVALERFKIKISYYLMRLALISIFSHPHTNTGWEFPVQTSFFARMSSNEVFSLASGMNNFVNFALRNLSLCKCNFLAQTTYRIRTSHKLLSFVDRF